MTSAPVPALAFQPTSLALLRHALAVHGDRDLIVEPDCRLTYAEADRLSRALARRLVLLGVGKGTRVAAKYPNGASWIIVWLAVTRIGGFFMPISSAYKAGEARKCLRIGDAQLFLTPTTIIGRDQHPAVDELLACPHDPAATLLLADLPFLREVVFTSYGPSDQMGAIDLLAPAAEAERRVPDAVLDAMEAEVTPADWMLAIFTSGSTSDPKCVIHTHGAPIRHATAIVDVNRWTSADRIFAGMPFFWVGGNCYTVLPVMLAGATILAMERFEAGAALDFMAREGATRVIGWPGVINPLLEHPTLPGHAIAAFDNPEWDPKLWSMTGLGMSETGSNHTVLMIEDRAVPAAAGSVGRPIPCIEHRIVDPDSGAVLAPGEVGNIQVRGYSLMTGFYKREREETFEPDGFYDTRDRGYLSDGYVFFAGRDVGVIKTAGNNVSAAEVEGALKRLPGVANAYVAGIPDVALGQLVGAAIVPAADGAPDAEAIRAALGAELSAYKVPRVIRFLEAADIPFMTNGKLDFRELVARIAGA